MWLFVIGFKLMTHSTKQKANLCCLIGSSNSSLLFNNNYLKIILKSLFKNLHYIKYCIIFKRPLRGRQYIPKMKHPDEQWFGHQCKTKKYMKLFCIFAMDILQGNYLAIDYVRKILF